VRLYIGQEVRLAGHRGTVVAIEGNTVELARPGAANVRVTLCPAPVKVRRPRPEGTPRGQ